MTLAEEGTVPICLCHFSCFSTCFRVMSGPSEMKTKTVHCFVSASIAIKLSCQLKGLKPQN